MRTELKTYNLFWPVMALALALRVWGIGFGPYHADEPIVINHALAYGTWDFNPHFFKIPPLASYLLFFVYGIFYVFGHILGNFPGTEQFQALFVQKPVLFYEWARWALGIIPGVLTVAALYRQGEKFFSKETAKWSAIFLAVNYLHVRDSHYAYVDMWMVFCAVMAVFSAYGTFKEGSLKHYLLSGFWIGAAAAFKYNAALVGIALLLAHFLGKNRKINFFLSAIAVSAATVIILNPYSLLSFKEFAGEILHQTGAEGAVGFMHPLFYSLRGAGEWAWLLLAVLGGFFLYRKDQKSFFVLFSFPVLFYLVLVFFSQRHERYVLPIVPFVCIAAGMAVDLLSAFEWKTWLPIRGIVFLLLVSVTLATGLMKSVYLDKLLTRPDTRDEAREWIEKNIPSGSGIAFSHTFYRPVLQRSEAQWQALDKEAPLFSKSVSAKNKILRKFLDSKRPAYQLYFISESQEAAFSNARPLLSPFSEGLKNEGAEYVVLHFAANEHPLDAFYEGVKKHGKLLKRFSPYKDADKNYSVDPYAVTSMPLKSEELFSRAKPGPVLEIYEMTS